MLPPSIMLSRVVNTARTVPITVLDLGMAGSTRPCVHKRPDLRVGALALCDHLAMADRTTDIMPTGTRQESDRTVLSVQEAATHFGVTPDAIRARLYRKTLRGEKVAGEWQIYLPDPTRPDTGDGGSLGRAQGVTPINRAVQEMVRRRLVENVMRGGARTSDVQVANDVGLDVASVTAIYEDFGQRGYVRLEHVPTGHMDVRRDSFTDGFRDLSKPLP